MYVKDIEQERKTHLRGLPAFCTPDLKNLTEQINRKRSSTTFSKYTRTAGKQNGYLLVAEHP